MSSEGTSNQDKQGQRQVGKEVLLDTPSGYIRRCIKIGRYTLVPDSFLKNITDDMAVIKGMPMREDDTLLLTFPKSGTNWTSEILKMLTSGKAEYHSQYKVNEWIDVQSLEKLESLASPRVLNSHVAVQDLPEQVLEKKCKVVIVIRNPKDVCVSMYNHAKGMDAFGGTWDDFLYLFMKGQNYCNWFEYTKEAFEYASAHDFVYLLNFEDLKKNGEEEIKRLAKFLKVEMNEQLANDIAEKCSFSKLKKAASEVKGARTFPLPGGKPPTFEIFRKGEVADWKNWFTVAQNEKFDILYEETMKGCDIEIKFTI